MHFHQHRNLNRKLKPIDQIHKSNILTHQNQKLDQKLTVLSYLCSVAQQLLTKSTAKTRCTTCYKCHLIADIHSSYFANPLKFNVTNLKKIRFTTYRHQQNTNSIWNTKSSSDNDNYRKSISKPAAQHNPDCVLSSAMNNKIIAGLLSHSTHARKRTFLHR